MKRTGYIFHPKYLKHETEPHPENPGRLEAIQYRLETSGTMKRLNMLAARVASEEEIAQIHDPAYIHQVKQSCADGVRSLDADTVISAESYEAACLAAGAGLKAVDQVVDGKVTNVFCAVRPPGHHAEKDRAMGFCLFNNVAIAARYAQAKRGLSRIFIFDWDVHHGNGTQHSFYTDASVYYASTHQFPFYPGTGAANETGSGDGMGTTLNLPLAPFSDDAVYLDLVENRVIPEMFRFKPDLILISAGFDAHEDDPLANMRISTQGFGLMTARIQKAANELCRGRLISMLEGGYNHEALSESVQIHLENLMAGTH
jgi:acetoin utilization deacetylase AcuC-like enzyme